MEYGLERFPALLASLCFTKALASVVFPLIAIMLKWLIVGKYTAGRYPLWGRYYCQWWVMDKTFLILGRGIFRSSSGLLTTYYRLMGAKIGRRCQIAKTAEIGEYDLLIIEDDTVMDACWARPFCLDQGEMVLEKIHIGRHCSISAKSSVAPGAIVPPGTCIGPLSSSYEMHDSVRSNRDTCRPAFRGPHWALVFFLGYPILTLVSLIPLLPWIGNLFLMVNVAMDEHWFETIHNLFDLLKWFTTPERIGFHILGKVIRGTVSPLLYVALCILTKWCVIGKFTAGPRNRSEWNIFKHWLMSQLLPGKDLAGVTHLVGTHYDVVSWIYRMLGAKIGQRVYWPGSGLELVEFDLLTVGDDVTFGSRSVYMCSDAKDQAPIVIGAGAMVADRCVLLPGVTIERNAVLGSGGLGKKGFTYTAGSVWVGSRHNNAVQLEKGDREAAMHEPTVRPFGAAFYGYKPVPYFMMPLWMHVFFNYSWTMFCTAWYAASVPYSLCLMVYGFGKEDISMTGLLLYMIVSYMIIFTGLCIVSTLLNILFKWVVIGRRVVGQQGWDTHSYCQRWQIYLTLGDAEKMKRGFSKLLSIPVDGINDEDAEDDEDTKKVEEDEVIGHARPDGLRQELKRRQREASHYILTAARLIAPVLEKRDWGAGYKWVIEALKQDYDHMSAELEIEKALCHLKNKEFDKAIDVLKAFEKKDQHLRAMASTNLSFIYFLEGELRNAESYADMAYNTDRYNAKALVNKGNCLAARGDLETAKQFYLEAIGVEADCVEATS